MTDEYWIENEQVLSECCSCILPTGCEDKCGPGRLELFRQWLFKPVGEDQKFSELRFRLAPSIVVRSEAELFGVSSPRFAIRAYLTENSFVNIRRNAVLQDMIYEAVKDDDVRDELIADLAKHEFAWTADSLFEIPSRFKLCPDFAKLHDVLSNHPTDKNGFKFLTSNLGNEFGEKFDGPLVPFVTHLSIGGGLCAQASCFMSLCLAECEQILGISEITKLAWSDDERSAKSDNVSIADGVIHIHGLSSERVTSFFSKVEIGLGAQLQTFVGEQNNLRFVKLAIQTYIANQVPLNVITSISRMKGWHNVKSPPILQPNDFLFDDKDRSKLPIGLSGDRAANFGKKQKNDHHCIVVVGASATHVCINDPATFPFVEATYSQLIDARAYLPEKGEEEIGAGSPNKREEIDTDEFEPAPFRMIAVTPKGVKTPLLDFVMEKKRDEDPDVITRPGKTGVMKMAFDKQQEERVLMGQAGEIVPNLGTYYLVEKKTDHSSGIQLESRRIGLPEFDWRLLGETPDDWYWIQQVEHPVAFDQMRNMLWFWRASVDEDEISPLPAIVLVQSTADGTTWEIRDDATSV